MDGLSDATSVGECAARARACDSTAASVWRSRAKMGNSVLRSEFASSDASVAGVALASRSIRPSHRVLMKMEVTRVMHATSSPGLSHDALHRVRLIRLDAEP